MRFVVGYVGIDLWICSFMLLFCLMRFSSVIVDIVLRLGIVLRMVDFIIDVEGVDGVV